MEYEKCPCSGTYEKHHVDVNMTVDGQPVVLKNIPQGKCPKCGSRVYKTDVLARVEGAMKGERTDRRQAIHMI